jgi:hypothetical protein
LSKTCIYDKEKACNGCDECYTCDLNPNKRCNNCGKCLELEGYDIRAIEVEDIFETQNDLLDYDDLNELHDEANDDQADREGFWEFIDDIKELNDLMVEEQNLKLHEEYPGLFVYKKTEK